MNKTDLSEDNHVRAAILCLDVSINGSFAVPK